MGCVIVKRGNRGLIVVVLFRVKTVGFVSQVVANARGDFRAKPVNS